MRRAAMAIVMLATLAGCASHPHGLRSAAAPAEPSGRSTAWRDIATAADQLGLDAIAQRWETARATAARRFAARLAAEGPLAEADAAQELPALPPGPYHCRLLRVGGSVGFASYKPDYCYVLGDGNGLTFTKMTGSILPGGWLYPDGPKRQILLGSLRRRPQDRAAAYNTDPARNVAGVVERVAPMRWRLTLVEAGRGGTLDVYELVPVTPDVPGAARAVPAAS